MRVYISVDIEGVTGIVNNSQTSPGERDYERGRRLMTQEANAAILGAIDAGAAEIVVNDSHGPMTNVLIEDLHPRARLISGRPKPLGMMQGIDSRFDAAFLIGYHGRHGTIDAVLDHTWSGQSIVNAELNGRDISEGDFSAALAGEQGVPIVLATGDENYCRQQRATLGDDLITVAVKSAIGRYAADSLSLEDGHRRIREAAARALTVRRQPYRVPAPLRLVLTFSNSARADAAAYLPDAERLDGLRVAYSAPDFGRLMRGWWVMMALGRATM